MLTHHENLMRHNQHYRREMMRSAERERLARLATSVNHRSLYRPLLAWAGRRLVRIGFSLLTMADGAKIEARSISYRQVI